MTYLKIYGILSIVLFLFSIINAIIFKIEVASVGGMQLVSLSVVNIFLCIFLIKLFLKFF